MFWRLAIGLKQTGNLPPISVPIRRRPVRNKKQYYERSCVRANGSRVEVDTFLFYYSFALVLTRQLT